MAGHYSDDTLNITVLAGSDADAEGYAELFRGVEERWSATLFNRRIADLPVNVYVNAGGEAAGSSISLALHGLQCQNIRAYFDAPTRTVVVLLPESDSRLDGTAAHEFVHALMADDFPDAPLWLSEGIASLEEARTKSGDIDDNWRLEFLRGALRARVLPTPDEIVAPACEKSGEFGLYLAAARYLAWAADEQDRLAPYYQGLRHQGRAVLGITPADFAAFVRKHARRLTPEIPRYDDAREHGSVGLECLAPGAVPNLSSLGGRAKPASDRHLKTGQ